MTASIDPALTEAFRRRYGGSPRIAVTVPGRVNLIGEHVDYQGGLVLPMAIDRFLIVLAARSTIDNAPARLRLHSLATGETVETTIADHAEADDAPSGALGSNVLGRRLHGAALSVLEAQRIPHERLAATDLLVASELPIGGGVSSSAALGVGVSMAIAALTETVLDESQLVAAARRSELVGAGVACGIMDPLAIAAGRAGAALLIDCRDGSFVPVPLPPMLAWLLVDTGIRHDNSDGRYATRQRECAEAAERLGVADLREAAERGVDPSTLPVPLDARARHCIGEHARTLAAVTALRAGDLEALGGILVDGHASLRDDFRVSCDELDEVVDTALELGGAAVHGARMTGGGFGGCVIVACAAATAERTRASLAAALPDRCTVTRIMAAPGATVHRFDGTT